MVSAIFLLPVWAYALVGSFTRLSPLLGDVTSNGAPFIRDHSRVCLVCPVFKSATVDAKRP